MYDSARDIRNQRRANVKVNRAEIEGYDAANHNIDLNSSSFQIRGSDGDINQNTQRLVYAAFKDTWTPTETTSGTFKTVIYSGTGASANISLGFQPDLLWIKCRTADTWPVWTDSIRGASLSFHIGRTDAEVNSTSNVAAFLPTGFAVNNGTRVNAAGEEYVAWCWKAGTDGLPHAGRIAERYDKASGFSMIKYIGDSGVRQIPHSLGTEPKMIGSRYSHASNWHWYHIGILPPSPEDYYVRTNTDANAVNDADAWADTKPEAYAYTVGQNNNHSGVRFMAYLFADVPGFMKLGEYSGNGADEGPIISCDFSVGFLMIKGIDPLAAQDWVICDNVRNPTNPRTKHLHLPQENSEGHYTEFSLDFTSTWFQIKTDEDIVNQANREYLYMAIKG